MKYVNTSGDYRTWTSLTHPDGHTLGLEAGETVALDLPDDFDDPYLKPATPAKRARRGPTVPDEGDIADTPDGMSDTSDQAEPAGNAPIKED